MADTGMNKRDNGLDVLRYLCAWMVICIHVPFPMTHYIEPLMRASVPVFCMLTGYFYDDASRRGRVTDQIRKVLRLLLTAYLICFLRETVPFLRAGGSLAAYLRYVFSVERVAKFLLVNTSLFSGHLWYLGALVYGLAVMLLLDRFGLRQKMHRAIPVLILMNLCLGAYSVVLFGVRLPLLLTRNFLGLTLPFLLLGDWLRLRQPRVKNTSLLLLILVSAAVVVGERLFFVGNFPAYNEDFYLGTAPLACGLFLLAVGNPRWFRSRPMEFAAMLGRGTATWIYILHPFVVSELESLLESLQIRWPWVEDAYLWLGTLAVLAISTGISWLIHAAGRRLKARRP